MLFKKLMGGGASNKYRPVPMREDPENFPIYSNWSVKISLKVELNERTFRIAQKTLSKNTVIQSVNGKLYYRENLDPESIEIHMDEDYGDLKVIINDLYYQPQNKTIIIRCNISSEKLLSAEGMELISEGNVVLNALMKCGYSVYANKSDDIPSKLFLYLH